ncbi:MAG: AAA family ATPase [Thermodesulfobacteriota bacterium]
MLEYLRIRNLALIEDVALEFAPGLNAITGETGAGKSFILRALDFLTGERLERDMVRAGADAASVEALFALADGDVVLRRELSAETGRSRIFLNDRLSSQDAVRDLKPRLVLHTSQHGQQRLLSPAYQSRIVDAFLPDQGLAAEKDRLLAELRAVAEERAALAARVAELAARRELFEYQAAEIAKVAPLPGEEQELSARREALQADARSAEAVERALALLHGREEGLLSLMDRLAAESRALAAANPDFAEDAAALEEARHRLRDLDARLRRRGAPGQSARDLERVEERLFALSKLKRKLGRSLEEIVGLGREIAETLSFLDSHALDERRLAEREKAAAKALAGAAAALSAARRAAAGELAGVLTTDLQGLGFGSGARVEFAFEAAELYPGIAEERARLLWLPNPGLPPQPLDRIASGGELSRFMLALAGLLSRQELPALLFDEVDAGVGGLTLNRLGERLAELAGRQQVILITHWPQLAALAGRHFSVCKDVSGDLATVQCRRLDGPGVEAELARMAGGGSRGEILARQLVRG